MIRFNIGRRRCPPHTASVWVPVSMLYALQKPVKPCSKEPFWIWSGFAHE